MRLPWGWNDIIVQAANLVMSASSGINESIYYRLRFNLPVFRAVREHARRADPVFPVRPGSVLAVSAYLSGVGARGRLELFSLRIHGVPPLLLQPLVENAIRHGFADRFEGGTVKIKAEASQGLCRFVIEDDGVGIERDRLPKLLESGAESRQGVGLLNINKRLKYEYGTQLQIESEAGRGTKVTVRIPAESA